jgi:hypothetical protein
VNSLLDLAVILVSWNVRALILDAIRTVNDDLAASGLTYELWVVDNGSQDGSIEAIRAAFPQVRLLAFNDNLGFAGANNVALRALGFRDIPQPNPDGPRAVYLLNPDTRTHPGATARMFQTLMELPDAGIVGARLEYEDGAFQHGAFGFPGLRQIFIELFPVDRLPSRLFGRLYNSGVNGRYAQRRYHGGKPFRVGHTLGATMMIKREAIEKTGLFDDQFFMYVEEVDWSLRIRRAGFHNYCEPRALVTHLAGQSTKQIRAQSLLNLWKSRFRFYRKHYSPLYVAAVRALVRTGAKIQTRRAHEQLPDGIRDEIVNVWHTVGQL